MLKLLTLATMLGGAVVPAYASDISVQDAWARATTPRATNAAVYLSIKDTGAGDRLIAVSTPAAALAAVHETMKRGDVMGMRPVEGGLPISSSGPTVLAPGGFHIMLMKLRKPLMKGSSFPLTLSFEKAGKIDTTVRVEAAAANGPMQDMGPGHDMDSMPGMTH